VANPEKQTVQSANTVRIDSQAAATLRYIRASMEAASSIAVPGSAGSAMGLVGLLAAVENIGARRLHTVMERLLETVSYEAAEHNGKPDGQGSVTIDAKYVDDHLGKLVEDEDLSRYIL